MSSSDFMYNWIREKSGKKTNMENKQITNEFEHCILCGVETSVKISTHVDMRHGYIEGAGQLCPKCYSGGTDRNHLAIPEHIIYSTSNDAELGAKVRQLYWESKK